MAARRLIGAALGLLLAAVAPAIAVATDAPTARDVRIEVLSGRADLVTGGDSVVAVTLPDDVPPSEVRVFAGTRDVTNAFETRLDGRLAGLVTGLPKGRTVIRALLADGSGAELTITNYSTGGPLFAGRQVTPWACLPDPTQSGTPPVGPKCEAPAKLSYVYRSALTNTFQPYDPAAPPSDVRMTTTGRGLTVPYIVRVETGTADRGVYQIAVLADPSKDWSRWQPQPAWNGALTVPFGFGCGAWHGQQLPLNVLDDAALSRGFAVAASSLHFQLHNCNDVVAAEAFVMLKERVVETLGDIRHTIGQGCSGGSMQQYSIAAAYPGSLDGLVVSCAFPDLWTTLQQIFDCDLLFRYFTFTSPHLWLVATQRALVGGQTNVGATCLRYVQEQAPIFNPTGDGPFGIPAAVRDNDCGLKPEERFSLATNPQGERCDVVSYNRSIFGTRARDGLPNRPIDNVGLQYGLAALSSGGISPAQFVDLNVKIGGFDSQHRPQPTRTEADPGSVATAYRTGRITDPRQLAAVPILDVRIQDNEQLHETFHSHSTRARLDKANGTHANHVIWLTAVGVDEAIELYVEDPPVELANLSARAVLRMDDWLTNIERDGRPATQAEKVARNKPAEVVDSCWILDLQTTDPGRCVQYYFGNPRMAAGGPLSDDVVKCHLVPLDRTSYSVAFTDEQWAQLQLAFPTGVCDWSRPSVDAQPTQPWTTFAGGPGGAPMGDSPVSRTFGRALPTTG